MSNSIAKNLKKLRARRGWSQLQLAEALGVQQSTVSRWERELSRPVGIYMAVVERLLIVEQVRK